MRFRFHLALYRSGRALVRFALSRLNAVKEAVRSYIIRARYGEWIGSYTWGTCNFLGKLEFPTK